MGKEAYVVVTVSSKRTLRADITPKSGKDGYPYSVTVNGKMWHEGKGIEHREEILQKVESLITKLQHELREAKDGRE